MTQTRPAPQQAQTQTRNAVAVVGSSADPDDVNQRLMIAQRDYNLVTPATAVGQLPEGLSVTLSVVEVDFASETYTTGGGKRGLAKSALDRISAGVGVSWDSSRSGRLDDSRDPRYCRYLVVGTYRQFDGTTVQIQGDKEMDLRPGSPQLANKTDKQVQEMRMHILSHAETKARLRAIRSLGVRTSYTDAELKKPFVVARVMFTGQTSDPELRRMFAERTADAFLGGRAALYGGPPAPALPAPQRAPMLGTAPAPPVGAVPIDYDDAHDFEPEPPRPTGRQAPPQQEQQDQGARSGQVIPGGKSKGTPVEDADDETLAWWSDRIAASVEDPEKERYRESNRLLLDAMLSEMDRRQGGEERY